MKHTTQSLPVVRISPGNGQYFFGYYDLQPYNYDETLYLMHKTRFRNRLQTKSDKAQVGFVDLSTGKFEEIDTTYAWNFQQGAMLQWNPSEPNREIIYNMFDGKSFYSVVTDIYTGKKRLLNNPIVNVSRDGKYGLSLNMSRIYDFRPGYGYAGTEDLFYYKNHSANDGIFLVDIENGTSRLVLSMDKIWDFAGGFFKKDEKIVINHITFNPEGSRFLMLVRNFTSSGQRPDTALITAARDGSDLYLLSDFGVQSHYFWLNNEDIIIYSDGKELDCSMGWGNNYILKDKTHQGRIIADGFFRGDNHMSFSPNNKYMITDTYPNSSGHQALRIYNPKQNQVVDLGNFYSMPCTVTDVRCDLHPRWNRKGNEVTFDSTHEGFRGVYKVELNDDVLEKLFKTESEIEARYDRMYE